MEKGEYRRLAAVENSHWWYRAMHNLVIGVCGGLCGCFVLKESEAGAIKILDAGCGTGGLTNKLGFFGRVIGLDISWLALSFAKRRELSLVNGSVNSLPFFDKGFDLVVSTSVIYHRLVDEDKAMDEFYRVLKPKGRIILILPALSWAWGVHDEAVHTRRRYTLTEATDLVESAGFEIIESRYIFGFLFPVFAVKRLVEKIFPKQERVSDLGIMPNFLNNFLFWLCRVEWKLGCFLKLPIGSSLTVVAEKKSEK